MNGQTKCYGSGEHPMCMSLVPAPMVFGAMMFGLLIGMIVGKKKAMMHGMAGMGSGMYGMGHGMMQPHGGMYGGMGMGMGMGMGHGGMSARKKMMSQMWGHHHHGSGAPCCCGQDSSSDMGEDAGAGSDPMMDEKNRMGGQDQPGM